VTAARYDEIGRGYAQVRRPDPRIARQIEQAVGSGRTVINVGAGTGSYEPPGTVVAVEPSAVMIAQRPPGAAPCVQAMAEALPFGDGAFDVALAVLTIHHWSNLEAGIGELRRVARRQVVLAFDVEETGEFWLARDYLPEVVELDRKRLPPLERVVELLGGALVEAVPVPHDCTDGFFGAYWRRPEAYLDPAVRAGISTLAVLGDALRPGLDRLAADLASGAWRQRNAALLELDEVDLGYRLLIAGT
jgi:SAM-dependent methyltransferase